VEDEPMKKFCCALFLLLFWPSAAWALSYPNQPKDFYGLPWGFTASQLAGRGARFASLEDKSGPISSYRRLNGSARFFGLDFDEARYLFYEWRFFLVWVTKANDSGFRARLYAQIARTHGPPTQQKDNIASKTSTYWWQGDTTFIVLTDDVARRQVTLSWYYQPLHQKWQLSARRG
jgi:hypothetical protein